MRESENLADFSLADVQAPDRREGHGSEEAELDALARSLKNAPRR